MGSLVSKTIQPNQEIIDLIYDDIKEKTGIELTRNPLRHVSIFDDDGNLYKINNHIYKIRNSSLSSPNNDRADLIEIRSLKALQQCTPDIYYLR